MKKKLRIVAFRRVAFVRVAFKTTYSILQYVNQCWECVSERKHKRKKKKKLPGLASDIVLDSTRFTQNSLLDDKFWKTPIKSYVAYNKNDEKEYDRQLRQVYYKSIFNFSMSYLFP